MPAQRTATAFALYAITSSATAGCVLPVPDGGEKTPSKPNLIGSVVAIKPDALLIRKTGETSLIQAQTGAATTYTKQHGGWLRRNDLQLGQQVWVWYQDCQAPDVGRPQVAYLRLVAEPGRK